MASSISGTCGITAALVVLTGTATSTQSAGSGGTFSFTSLADGIYFVTAQLSGFTFSPWSQKVTVAGSNVSGVNFTGVISVPPPNVLTKNSSVLSAGTGQGALGVIDPCVIFEGNAQILSGNVFKMWFTASDIALGVPATYYAESTTGLSGSWTQLGGATPTPVMTNVSGYTTGSVFKSGSVYHGYYTTGNFTGAAIDHLTSSDGVTWTLANASVVVRGAAGTWDTATIFAMTVVYIDGGGTWWATYSGIQSSNNILNTGLLSSTDGSGAVWTKYASNPILQNFSSTQVIHQNSMFYAFGDVTLYGKGGTFPFEFPTNLGFAQSANLATGWSNPVPMLFATQAFEGAALNGNYQLDTPSVLEVSGTTYMFYGASPTAAAGTGFKIGLASRAESLAQVVADIQSTIAPQFVQTATATFASGTTRAAAFTNNNILGNTLLAVSYNNVTSGTPTVTDSQSNTWTLVNSEPFNSGGNRLDCFIATNCKAGANTVTYHSNIGSSVAMDLVILEYGPSTLDVHGAAQGVSATPTSPTVVTNNAFETIVAFVALGVSTLGSLYPGFAQRATDLNDCTVGDQFGSLSGGSYTAQFSQTSSGSWAAGVLTLTSPTASTPTFSPVAGTYAPTSITITSSSVGALIYYTIDGTTPTTISTLYSGPVPLSSSATVKAIASGGGFLTSAVGSAAYTITSSAKAADLLLLGVG